jgi:hypothetical protein
MSHESTSSVEISSSKPKSVMFEKENITIVMQEAIKNENEKISKKTRKKLSSSTSTSNDNNAIQMCISSSSSLTSSSCTSSLAVNTKNGNTDDVILPSGGSVSSGVADHQRCKGEKKKGGRCSRKAKNGEYCETHSTERKEMERKIEGGIYVYRCKDDLYDIEEILRRGMT